MPPGFHQREPPIYGGNLLLLQIAMPHRVFIPLKACQYSSCRYLGKTETFTCLLGSPSYGCLMKHILVYTHKYTIALDLGKGHKWIDYGSFQRNVLLCDSILWFSPFCYEGHFCAGTWSFDMFCMQHMHCMLNTG